MLTALERVMLEHSLGRVIFMCWQGVAASVLPHGLTICGASGLQPSQFADTPGSIPKLDSQGRTALEEVNGPRDEITMVVADEMSTFDSIVLGHLSNRFADFLEGDCVRT